MKTLNDFQQEVSEKYGYKNFVALLDEMYWEDKLNRIEESAELYAEYRAKEAKLELMNSANVIAEAMDRVKKESYCEGYEAVVKDGFESKEKYVPYQRCPICNGEGKVLADGFTSSVYATCTVCNGAKIIVPFVVNDDYKQGWNEALNWAAENVEITEGFRNRGYGVDKQSILKGLK